MVCICAKSLQSCPSLCDPMDASPPGSSVHGILQARILQWVAMSSSRGSSHPRDQTCISYFSPALAGRFFITRATWEAHSIWRNLIFVREHSWNPLGEEDIVKQTVQDVAVWRGAMFSACDTPIVSVKWYWIWQWSADQHICWIQVLLYI